MTRKIPVIALLIGLLAIPAGASAQRQGGYDQATRKLEAAFKIAGFERAGDPQGCYPGETEMASLIRKQTPSRVAVTGGFGSVGRAGVIFVIRGRSNCNRIVMAIRASQGLFVLDSEIGPVFLRGKKGRSEESIAGGRGRLRGVNIVGKSVRTNTNQDEPERLDVFCPGKTFPVGGGMVSSPALAMDGEGVYPHSYERLGVQRGFHVTTVYFDPAAGGSTPRQVNLQVVCGKGLVPVESPHKTVFVRAGQTKSATARCPGGTKLFSGGFQRSNWLRWGGSYPTESRAIGTKAWRVTGSGFGDFGGELTAVALCAKDPSLPISEVSASTPLGGGLSGSATTPACPGGRTLTTTGFSIDSKNAFFGGSSINSGNTSTATGFAFFGPATLTAYGYCVKA